MKREEVEEVERIEKERDEWMYFVTFWFIEYFWRLTDFVTRSVPFSLIPYFFQEIFQRKKEDGKKKVNKCTKAAVLYEEIKKSKKLLPRIQYNTIPRIECNRKKAGCDLETVVDGKWNNFSLTFFINLYTEYLFSIGMTDE